ncbi:LptF/LptG family permease [Desulfofustis limnaeus]|uniref:YjgP/YjgQ family permease n=1 Tax=Desulfofustis limnaeus TaxID=2740163 RepID=A0ABN6M6F3_9BACT|nr:LptF/LptG family permease [Desulfofustis limnaeus]BDD87133.1 hypothetical protein DPPLL_14980 [Desulfofustis limnaeus]
MSATESTPAAGTAPPARKKRLPLLYYSYLTAEMLAPFFASFVIMNGVFFLVKLIPFLDVVLELDISFGDFVRLFSYLFPNMFLYSIPMAAMLGVTIGFSRLSNDSEILAFKASGISLYHVLPPLLLVSLCVSLITSYFSIKLIPAGESAMQQMMYQLAKEKIDKGIKEREFTEALGDLVVFIDSIDQQTGEWRKVWVSDMRERSLPAITMAGSGSMVSNLDRMMVTLLLRDGSMHIPEQTSAQTVSFDSYVINIPVQPVARPPGSKTRGTMTMNELLAESSHVGLDSEQGRSYLTEFHKRLVLPVGCLFLCLLGMPLGLQAGPGRRAIGIPFGLALYIVYYLMFSVSRNVSVDSTLSIPLVMWIPNTVFLCLALLLIHRVAREQPLLPEAIQTLFEKLGNNLIALANRLWTSLGISRTKKSTSLPDDEGGLTADEKKQKLRGDVHHRVFHFPECDHYYCKNCSIEFKDVKVAQQAGFSPCPQCQSLMPSTAAEEQHSD